MTKIRRNDMVKNARKTQTVGRKGGEKMKRLVVAVALIGLINQVVKASPWNDPNTMGVTAAAVMTAYPTTRLSLCFVKFRPDTFSDGRIIQPTEKKIFISSLSSFLIGTAFGSTYYFSQYQPKKPKDCINGVYTSIITSALISGSMFFTDYGIYSLQKPNKSGQDLTVSLAFIALGIGLGYYCGGQYIIRWFKNF